MSTAADSLQAPKDFLGLAPDHWRLVRAPGRVNIIGEHTDYNDGLVLPTNTATHTWIASCARSDRLIRIESRRFGESRTIDLDRLESDDRPGWIKYARGVAAVLESEGIRLCGADMLVDGDIPIGGGLSSSASFEVGLAIALLDVARLDLSRSRIATLCRRAETEYAGLNCGIMDQLVIAACDRDKAMLIDCKSMDTKLVDLPGNARFLLTHSGVRHKLTESEYNQREQECRKAVTILAKKIDGLRSLRELTLNELDSYARFLDSTLHLRCTHVIRENRRVEEAFRAMQDDDVAALGALITASHNSLRDYYDVSCKEVDRLVELADSCDGVLGSRMVGAGFGGCVLSLVAAGKVEATAHTIRQRYGAMTGCVPWMHIVQGTEAAGLVARA